jgi:hypothetical protein
MAAGLDARNWFGRDKVIDRGIGSPHTVVIDQPRHNQESDIGEAAQLFDG